MLTVDGYCDGKFSATYSTIKQKKEKNMKSRLAKKIIKASATYCFYCRNCDTHSRFKYHPYWTSHWNRYGSQMKYVPTGVWRLDQRLNAALRRLPQYTQKLLCAVRAKQMELKRIRLHRLLERVEAKQSVKEGNSNENVSSSIDGKMECL